MYIRNLLHEILHYLIQEIMWQISSSPAARFSGFAGIGCTDGDGKCEEDRWGVSESLEEGVSSGNRFCDGDDVGSSDSFLIACSVDILVGSVGTGSCISSDEVSRKLWGTPQHVLIHL